MNHIVVTLAITLAALASPLIKYEFNSSAANWKANLAATNSSPSITMQYDSAIISLTANYIEINYTMRYYDTIFKIPPKFFISSTIMLSTNSDIYTPNFQANLFISIRFTYGKLVSFSYYPYNPTTSTYGGVVEKTVGLDAPGNKWLVVTFSAENKADNSGFDYMISLYNNGTTSYFNGSVAGSILKYSSEYDSNQDRRSDLVYMTHYGAYSVKMSSFVIDDTSLVNKQCEIKCLVNTPTLCKICDTQANYYNETTGECKSKTSGSAFLHVFGLLMLLLLLIY